MLLGVTTSRALFGGRVASLLLLAQADRLSARAQQACCQSGVRLEFGLKISSRGAAQARFRPR